MKKSVIKLVLFVSIFIFAAMSVQAGRHIDNCSVISASGNLSLNASLSSLGTCLNITASNVEIDCLNGSGDVTFNITGGHWASSIGIFDSIAHQYEIQLGF